MIASKDLHKYVVWREGDTDKKSARVIEHKSRGHAAREYAETRHEPEDISHGEMELVVQDEDGTLYSHTVDIDVQYTFYSFENGKLPEGSV